VLGVAVSPDGRRIVSAGDDKTAKVWDVKTGQHLLTLAGHADDVNAVAVSRNGQYVVSASDDRTVRVWDAGPGPDARSHQLGSAVFHLDRLLRKWPGQRSRLLPRRSAILSAALKADPRDAWAICALARQAITDPESVPGRAALLTSVAALAKNVDDDVTNRLHGGLLLRTGSAQEALGPLHRALKKRSADAPPLEELLLALARASLKQPVRGEKYRQAALSWLQRGPRTVQAAAMSGLGGAGPFAALAGLAVKPPDPRLNTFADQTPYELRTLRAEVDRAFTKH
jgi:hypothetical protein